MAGDDYLGFNNSAYLSERQCCDRNRALGHFLAENGCLPKGADVKKIIELYSQVTLNVSFTPNSSMTFFIVMLIGNDV